MAPADSAVRFELPEYLVQRYISRKLDCMGPAAPADHVRAAVELLLHLVRDLRQEVAGLRSQLLAEGYEPVRPGEDS
jgi:hypothetical protein